MGQNEELRVLLQKYIRTYVVYVYFSIQEIFEAVDTENMGDIYQRDLIVYLKELHGGKFSNLKVKMNQTKAIQAPLAIQRLYSSALKPDISG